jgi:hypothetical protein
MLGKLGVVRLICNILIHESNFYILEETLLLSIAMLLGGNIEIQTLFAEFIQ